MVCKSIGRSFSGISTTFIVARHSTLERCWDVKTAVNACILEASGKNNYKIPHGFKDVQTISAPIACDSEAEEDPVARILDYEGIHPTLPSSLPR